MDDVASWIIVLLLVPMLVLEFLTYRLFRGLKHPEKLKIHQTGGSMPNGVPLGGKGTFQETPLPAGSAFPSGTILSWSANDTLVTLTVSPDGSQCVAAVDPSDKGTAFVLSCSGAIPGQSTPVSGTLSVPILPAAVPVPTSIEITQIA